MKEGIHNTYSQLKQIGQKGVCCICGQKLPLNAGVIMSFGKKQVASCCSECMAKDGAEVTVFGRAVSSSAMVATTVGGVLLGNMILPGIGGVIIGGVVGSIIGASTNKRVIVNNVSGSVSDSRKSKKDNKRANKGRTPGKITAIGKSGGRS